MKKYHIRKKSNDIAIIGMAGRFPGAMSLHEFWENLSNGVCSIKFFSKEELAELGVDKNIIEHPNYINAAGTIEDLDKFDEYFFNLSGLNSPPLAA